MSRRDRYVEQAVMYGLGLAMGVMGSWFVAGAAPSSHAAAVPARRQAMPAPAPAVPVAPWHAIEAATWLSVMNEGEPRQYLCYA